MAHNIIVLRLREAQVVAVQHYSDGPPQQLHPESNRAGPALAELAAAHPEAFIAWYDERLQPFLSDPRNWPDLIRHPLELLHLGSIQRCDQMVDSLGMVDFDSPFLLPGPANDRYATWLIAPAAGIGHASLLNAMRFDGAPRSFAVALFAFGYRGVSWGLCPYAEPALLAQPIPEHVLQQLQQPLSNAEIAALIRRNHGRKWLLFWLLANLLFRHTLPLLAVLRAAFGSSPPAIDPAAIARLHPGRAQTEQGAGTVDAIIPTLGRPEHVLNLLRDLAKQTMPPKTVFVIEQCSESQADQALAEGIAAEAWPFAVAHEQVAWAGACRARNLGLRASMADWVLLLDDDIRVQPDMIAQLIQTARSYQVGAASAAVYRPHQQPGSSEAYAFPRLWSQFAAGASLVSRQVIGQAGGFDQQLEGGYGEDTEFGLRLRQHGTGVLYVPGVPVLHLKAPAGGFRANLSVPWAGGPLMPRPSPTLLYMRNKHHRQLMRQGYRLFYTIKRLLSTAPLRWPRELPLLTRQWRCAEMWANLLAAGRRDRD